MAEKYLPEEVSDKELAAMEAAGELPKAKVDTYGAHPRLDPETYRYFWEEAGPRRVVSSPVGGETPGEAMASWEAQRDKAEAVGDQAYKGSWKHSEDRMDGINRLSEVLGLRKGRGFDQFNPDVAVGLYRAHQQGKLTLGPEVLQIVAAITRSDSAQAKAWKPREPAEEQRVEAVRSLRDLDEYNLDQYTTGADDPTRPTRTELPPMTERAQRRQRAAEAVIKKHGNGE